MPSIRILSRNYHSRFPKFSKAKTIFPRISFNQPSQRWFPRNPRHNWPTTTAREQQRYKSLPSRLISLFLTARSCSVSQLDRERSSSEPLRKPSKQLPERLPLRSERSRPVDLRTQKRRTMVLEVERGPSSSNYDAIVAGSVVPRWKWDSKGRDRADSSPAGSYETFGARVLGASPASYCSPSGRKTNFDQILLRPYKTDRFSRVMVPINDSSIR